MNGFFFMLRLHFHLQISKGTLKNRQPCVSDKTIEQFSHNRQKNYLKIGTKSILNSKMNKKNLNPTKSLFSSRRQNKLKTSNDLHQTKIKNRSLFSKLFIHT